MAISSNGAFDPKAFLASMGEGRSITKSRDGDVIFSQGDPAELAVLHSKGKGQGHHAFQPRQGSRRSHS